MKRTPFMMIFIIFFTLIFLQFSSCAVRKYSADEISAEVEETVEEAVLLADKHEAAGIGCNDCHEETPSHSLVPKVVCLTCHEDYKELATSYPNPHNAHITYSDCGDCHHAHRASEMACQECHGFNLQVP